ncbi:uncharacterized protein MELLADRAFT_92744 [Melampsora larici-populina 98AG31]|uniref:Uncharacterized protein n=1 Tax=Melampsora larici-populina (strain 98AG31 / pathotype 3-4-7) TaxID=747676 RepID=F4S2L2_MELLP|nr:uncharacterized protein MELLADRAFT_92744 [Melampsora larici-populina 98AG31]EGG01023.1 hypothetical protein MELLADRAFT_92744 [Melampsora larici-populina 98AG31]
MKVPHFRKTFSYFKNCANKARNWLALTARRFPPFSRTADPSFSTPASVSSSDARLSPPNLPMNIDPTSLVTRELGETAQSPMAPISIPSRSSRMSIDTTSLVTPQFSSFYAIPPPSFSPTSFTHLTPFVFSAPPSITTSIRSIESYQLSTGSTPPAHSGGHDTFQEILDIHRLSPTPSFLRNPRPLLNIAASPPDSVTQLPTQTPPPCVSYSPHNSVAPPSSPTYSRPAKRSFSLSIVDDSNTQSYKRTKRIKSETSLVDESNMPTSLRDKGTKSESFSKKRRFSLFQRRDQQCTDVLQCQSPSENPLSNIFLLSVQPYKRYKMSSPVRLYMSDVFPAPSASRHHYGLFLDEDKTPVFWASLAPTTDSSRVLNELHEE